MFLNGKYYRNCQHVTHSNNNFLRIWPTMLSSAMCKSSSAWVCLLVVAKLQKYSFACSQSKYNRQVSTCLKMAIYSHVPHLSPKPLPNFVQFIEKNVKRMAVSNLLHASNTPTGKNPISKMSLVHQNLDPLCTTSKSEKFLLSRPPMNP